MKNAFRILSGLVLTALHAAAVQAALPARITADSCAQIRAQIQTQTGLLPTTDIALLERLGTHPECRFSAAEVYRAAYGDRSLPRQEQHERRGRQRHDDDD